MTTQTLLQIPHLNPSEEVGPNIATSVHRTSQLQTSSIKPTSTKNASKSQPEDLSPYLSKIALSHQTPFQKKVLTLLCQVPRGEHTTYAALAKHLSSSPRAVGNALRNNPFAPQVPCHRVLASDGRIGGFKGSWGRKGKEGANDGQKRSLLKGEGVRFDSGGRVVGRAWDAFR
jgi:methylated-DNA-[protein]-cysteine S-methyltransferase